jgi:hypothetical protein
VGGRRVIIFHPSFPRQQRSRGFAGRVDEQERASAIDLPSGLKVSAELHITL